MISFLSNLLRYVRGHIFWFGRAWRVWGSISGFFIVLSCIFLFLPGEADDRVRYCGLFLELSGILTVALGLREKRILFGRKSIFEQLKYWGNQRPRWKLKHFTMHAEGSVSSNASASGSGTVWRGPVPSATIEARLEAIEANQERLRNEQKEIKTDLKKETRERTQALNTERSTRESITKEIITRLDKFGAGGLPLEFIGVILLLFGVILATIPVEIVNILS